MSLSTIAKKGSYEQRQISVKNNGSGGKQLSLGLARDAYKEEPQNRDGIKLADRQSQNIMGRNITSRP
jgi:uncharacterized membrane protein